MNDRRQRLIKLASAAAFLTVVVVAVLIVVSGSESGGGDSGNITDAKLVDRELSGIPQKGMVLGDPGAEVTVIEFGDLQCPVCKGYAEEVLPQVIDSQVRSGKAKLDFRNYTIIGPQSTPAGAAAIAAGEQGRGWNFIELFYRNQGTEDSGYADDAFLTAIAKAAKVPDIAQWDHDRHSRSVLEEVSGTTSQAESLGFSGTPSFAVDGPASGGLQSVDTTSTSDPAGAIEAAIEDAS